MKNKFLSFLQFAFIFLFLSVVKANAQTDSCCSAPDSLKVTFVGDSTFCVSWVVIKSPLCDSAARGTIAWRPIGDSVWLTHSGNYSPATHTVTYCDSIKPATKYQWRVRNTCITYDSLTHRDTVIHSPWIKGPNFTSDTASFKKNGSIDQLSLQTLPQINTRQSIKMYPNPTHDIVTIEGYAAASSNLKIIVTNTAGKNVAIRDFSVPMGSYKIPYNISTLTKGFYFVTINDGKASSFLKLRKE
ncbi:T9SS type A sorting domain-containing protein [Limnovirga soli]|uniref:T9SS type A sorting domain-containing protein n=1 Tax=Limnovirga soli TaxID=2656915 RepID=A0A8J8FHA2_9BACT|nr:T9SS type A sorting domain-containing protein [Limnovirga soli]NNV55044.1 T9SS type A sorting domain-containing protein [Limnovirga soli]